MVSVENLSYEVKGKTLINAVSVDFESGTMHLILGPNGAGKSTLVKLISGELQPTTGSILMDGIPLPKISLSDRARRRAVLSQNLELSFPLTVREVVIMGRYPHFEGKPGETDIEICEGALKLFDLSEMKTRNYLTLSGGEKQRVQFARVFAQIWQPINGKPRLLLLDEPLTFLDIYYQYDLMDKIKDFMSQHADLTVIGVVHDLNIAAKYADRVMLLKDKTIRAYGHPKDVLNKKNIFEVFKVNVKNHFEIE